MKALHKYITEGYSGAGIILTCNGRVLFQLRKHPRSWAFIGGGINRSLDHDLLDCAIRELYEESGILLKRSDVDPVPVHRLGCGRYEWKLFHAEIQQELIPYGLSEFSDEYLNYAWVSVSDYRKELDNAAGRHHPLFFFVSHQMKRLSSFYVWQ
ncbi:MAG: NUDIX hydrolase [Bullifex sp.]